MSDVELPGYGSPTPALSFATPDNVTIFGDGVAGASGTPLTTGALLGGAPLPPVTTIPRERFSSSPVTAGVALRAGAPARIDNTSKLQTAINDSLADCAVLGLAPVAFALGDKAGLVTSGPLALTAAEWDAVTGDVGGLVPGDRYYVAGDGGITKTLPAAPSFVQQVGIAVTATLMWIDTGGARPGV